eukprot:gene5926-8173_t
MVDAMEYWQSAIEFANIAQINVNNYFAQGHEQKLHKNSIEHANVHHESEKLLEYQTYLIATFTEFEQYCQELNENLVSSTRDAERDMADQRNQQYQTVLFAASVVLSALISVQIQGNLEPIKEVLLSYWIEIIYSVSISFGILSLFVCIIFCIELTLKVNKFMYEKSSRNIKHLKTILDSTQNMIGKLKQFFVVYKNLNNNSTRIPNSQSANDPNQINEDETKENLNNNNNSDNNNNSTSDLWKSHEKIIHNCLQKRDENNSKIFGINDELIDDHWKTKLSKYPLLLCFYLGTLSTLISIATFMVNNFLYLGSKPAATISGVVILVFTMICASIAFYLRKRSSVNELFDAMEREAERNFESSKYNGRFFNDYNDTTTTDNNDNDANNVNNINNVVNDDNLIRNNDDNN